MIQPNHSIKIDEIINRGNPIYIAFSGGFDSTLITYEVLYKLSELNSNLQVNLVSTIFDGVFISSSEGRDAPARDKLIEFFRKMFPNVNFNVITQTISISSSIEIDTSKIEFNNGKGAIPLQLNQFSYILTIMPTESSLLLGYIRGDNATSELEGINKLIDSYNNLLMKNIKLEVPLYRYDKSTVLSILFDISESLPDLCNTCDNNYNPHELDHNCRCGSCGTVKSALFRLATSNLERHHDLAITKLKEWYGITISENNNSDERVESIDE